MHTCFDLPYISANLFWKRQMKPRKPLITRSTWESGKGSVVGAAGLCQRGLPEVPEHGYWLQIKGSKQSSLGTTGFDRHMSISSESRMFPKHHLWHAELWQYLVQLFFRSDNQPKNIDSVFKASEMYHNRSPSGSWYLSNTYCFMPSQLLT